jgi:hypothetical protein
LARRLKYIVDVYSWRYVCFDGDPQDTDGPKATAIVALEAGNVQVRP